MELNAAQICAGLENPSYKTLKMSIVPTEATGGISELPAFLKRWMTIQEEMSTLNSELKQRRTQSKALKDVILRIMESNKVAALNTSKGVVVHKTKETAEKISSEYLLKHCKEFFNGDETRAKALVAYLEEHRTTVTRSDLKLQGAKGDDERLSHRS